MFSSVCTAAEAYVDMFLQIYTAVVTHIVYSQESTFICSNQPWNTESC